MTNRCNRSGVRVYVDVVLNHMAGSHPPTATVRGSAGSTAEPGAFYYPAVPFEREHFHPTCTITDWNGAHDLRNCAVAGLPDLNQTLPYVRQQQVAFLNRLVALGAGGFRVDAAKHMWPADLKVWMCFLIQSNSARYFKNVLLLWLLIKSFRIKI